MKGYCTMNNLVRNPIVKNDIQTIWQNPLFDWELYKNKTFFITGATGIIGSFIVRCILAANDNLNLNIKVIASVRDLKKAKKFFVRELVVSNKNLKLHIQDINEPIKYKGKVDYIIHCASNTHSKYFVEYPNQTYNTILDGTKNILEFARKKNVKKVINLSSMEAYGQIDTEKPLKEDDLGLIDINSPRSSYPRAKREAENLCKKYAKEYNLPVLSARLAQVIGANADYNDFHIYAHIARCVVEKKDIILNTTGESVRSFCYITDVINAIFILLSKGKNGEVYNVANEKCTSKIIDTVQNIVKKYSFISYKIDLKENSIYPKTTHWNLDTSKIRDLGFKCSVSIEDAYSYLISSFYYQLDIKEIFVMPPEVYKHPLEKIFSIKNKDRKKILTLFGKNFNLDNDIINKIRSFIYRMQPLKKNKIVFVNLNGKTYTCNPKYIAEEIMRRGLDWELVWLVKDIKKEIEFDNFPKNIRMVSFFNKKSLKELSNAKIWVDNCRKDEHIRLGLEKRKGQFYINTFHGSFGIKRLEGHMNTFINKRNNAETLKVYKKEGTLVDYFISNCPWESKILPEALYYTNCKIKEFGHPRNDIFFKPEEEKQKIKEKVYSKYGIEKNKKIILYAPTYRSEKILDCYAIDIKNLLKVYGEDTVVLIRMHHILRKEAPRIFEFSDKIINASLYSDIQELMVASEMMITDYSSCIYDFILTKKPGFIYATDIEKYNTDRGLYYPLEQTPFSIARNNAELIENIKNFDYDSYKRKVDEFLKEKGNLEDGNASKRVVDLMEEIINNA